jgi:hypothetical protein
MGNLMTRVVLTRNQFEKIKEVFEQYDVDYVEWNEESPSGIGPNVKIRFHTRAERPIEIDITDVSSW